MKATTIVLFVTEESDRIYVTEYPGKYTQEFGITSGISHQSHYLPPKEALGFIRKKIEDCGVKH